MIKRLRGQSTIEYAILIIIIIAVMVSMQNYVKRGFQGRWKASVDEMGDQYDPAKVNSLITYTQDINAESSVRAVRGIDPLGLAGNGYFTDRADSSNSIETKTGNTIIYAP